MKRKQSKRQIGKQSKWQMGNRRTGKFLIVKPANFQSSNRQSLIWQSSAIVGNQ